MITKTLLTLTPDPKSMEQAILRIHHEPYYWLRLDLKEIDVINMEKFGCSVERESGVVTPVWFKGLFFQSLMTFFTEL